MEDEDDLAEGATKSKGRSGKKWRKEYLRLRTLVPALEERGDDEELTKVEVIEETIRYIDALHRQLASRLEPEGGDDERSKSPSENDPNCESGEKRQRSRRMGKIKFSLLSVFFQQVRCRLRELLPRPPRPPPPRPDPGGRETKAAVPRCCRPPRSRSRPGWRASRPCSPRTSASADAATAAATAMAATATTAMATTAATKGEDEEVATAESAIPRNDCQ